MTPRVRQIVLFLLATAFAGLALTFLSGCSAPRRVVKQRYTAPSFAPVRQEIRRAQLHIADARTDAATVKKHLAAARAATVGNDVATLALQEADRAVDVLTARLLTAETAHDSIDVRVTAVETATVAQTDKLNRVDGAYRVQRTELRGYQWREFARKFTGFFTHIFYAVAAVVVLILFLVARFAGTAAKVAAALILLASLHPASANDCHIRALEFQAKARLERITWARVLGVHWGSRSGHAYCIYASPGGAIYAHDYRGSRPLQTRSRELNDIVRRLAVIRRQPNLTGRWME